MKMVGVREIALRGVTACVDEAQKEGIVITKHGKPAAVMIGVEGYDVEDVMLMTSPKFWKMIEKRRAETRTSLAEFERELAARKKAGARRRKKA
jgi:PHD/YefM family antitoxin component YafN of YafNO toxin-antitoxin module